MYQYLIPGCTLFYYVTYHTKFFGNYMLPHLLSGYKFYKTFGKQEKIQLVEYDYENKKMFIKGNLNDKHAHIYLEHFTVDSPIDLIVDGVSKFTVTDFNFIKDTHHDSSTTFIFSPKIIVCENDCTVSVKCNITDEEHDFSFKLGDIINYEEIIESIF